MYRLYLLPLGVMTPLHLRWSAHCHSSFCALVILGCNCISIGHDILINWLWLTKSPHMGVDESVHKSWVLLNAVCFQGTQAKAFLFHLLFCPHFSKVAYHLRQFVNSTGDLRCWSISLASRVERRELICLFRVELHRNPISIWGKHLVLSPSMNHWAEATVDTLW